VSAEPVPNRCEVHTLADGRRISWREYGDPRGAPVLWNHGGLVLGRDVSLADGPARDLGLRIVAPDRPGIGDSDPQPGRDTVMWAADAAELLDSLGVGAFGVLGWSLGGEYALACGARLAPRVTRVGVIAGTLSMNDPTAFAQLNGLDRAFSRVCGRSAPAGTAMFAAVRLAARARPATYQRRSAKGLGTADADVISRLPPGSFAAWNAAAMAHPRGMVEEYRAMVRPWGFTLGEVAVPVDLWQGDLDHMVPARWAHRLAEQLPDATLHFVRGAGHFLAYDRWPEVLAPFTE